MFVSRYPHNMSFGEVEYNILRKLLAGIILSDEEENRADQMSKTLEQNEQNTRDHRHHHRHRVPTRNNETSVQFEVEQEQEQEQLSGKLTD